MPTMLASPPRDLIRKTFPTHIERKAGAGDRVRRFVLTTDTLDRDFEVVIPVGAQYYEYLRNPQMLWAHKYDHPPVGKCLKLELVRRDSALVGDFEFARTKFADEIFGLYRDGFLRAVSIGFRALEVGPPTGEMMVARPELAKCLRIIKRWNLFEVSAVPIPSNPEALEEAVQKGLRLSPGLWSDLSPSLSPTRHAPAQIKSRLVRELGWSPERVESLTLQQTMGLLDLLDKSKKPRVVPTGQEPRDDDGTPRRRPADEDSDTEIDDEAVDANDAEQKPTTKPSRANGQVPVKIAVRTDRDVARDVANAIRPHVAGLVQLSSMNAMLTILGRDTARRSR
jgi:HK97 family phage prohead protease